MGEGTPRTGCGTGIGAGGGGSGRRMTGAKDGAGGLYDSVRERAGLGRSRSGTTAPPGYPKCLGSMGGGIDG